MPWGRSMSATQTPLAPLHSCSASGVACTMMTGPWCSRLQARLHRTITICMHDHVQSLNKETQ